MSRLTQDQKIQPQWWGKTLVGFILGLAIAYGLVAIFAWFGPGGIDAKDKVQFNMWMISPIWLFILSFVYLFKTTKTAFLYLFSANIAIYSLYFLLKGVA